MRTKVTVAIAILGILAILGGAVLATAQGEASATQPPLYTVQTSHSVPSGEWGGFGSACDAGDIATGGGFYVGGDYPSYVLGGSSPMGGVPYSGTSWHVSIKNTSPSEFTVDVLVICMDLGVAH